MLYSPVCQNLYVLAVSLRRVQQLSGALQQSLRHLAAAGDASQLRLTGLPVQQDNVCKGSSLFFPFLSTLS